MKGGYRKTKLTSRVSSLTSFFFLYFPIGGELGFTCRYSPVLVSFESE